MDDRYRVLLHMHNPQLDQRFWVTVDSSTREAVVAFDPADRVRARELGTRPDVMRAKLAGDANSCRARFREYRSLLTSLSLS